MELFMITIMFLQMNTQVNRKDQTLGAELKE